MDATALPAFFFFTYAHHSSSYSQTKWCTKQKPTQTKKRCLFPQKMSKEKWAVFSP